MTDTVRTDRESMEYDVVIVGAGPSGLSCAVRLKQLAAERGQDVSVCVLEKGSEVGAHLLSGAAFEPRALNELFPDWQERGAPVTTKATADKFVFLTKKHAIRLPTPPQMNNHGNYIISLGQLGRWLAQQAEALGVEIYPGFAASEILYDESGAVRGVATNDMGIGKNGEKTAHFEPGIELHARQTVFAEGCHGSLTKKLIAHFDLRADSDPQTYGLGVKEIWEIKPEHHREGLIVHTLGWPMDSRTYGGSFMYHAENNQLYIGYVVGLDYENPYLSPFHEMQRFKLHPSVRKILEGGRRVSYGARALVEGGWQSLPRLTFPGGLLIGDTAGFLNVPKIKGNHTAMKSGMVAAEALYDLLHGVVAAGRDAAQALESGADTGVNADTNADVPAGTTAAAVAEAAAESLECIDYPIRLADSWVWKELYKVRNIRPGFRFGLFWGLVHAAFQTAGGWRLPYTLKNHADYAQLKKAADCKEILYPKPDGVFTFDRLSSVHISNTMHEEDQPVHLKLRDPSIPIARNLPEYGEPARLYCPAGVYEVVEAEGKPHFVINAQNCVHCKTCDIKDPAQNIDWTVPQGGGGPNYPNM